MDKCLTLKKRGDSRIILEEVVSLDSIVTVGSIPGATIELEGDGIAPEQFVVIAEESKPVLMNRAKGTFLNGAAINAGARIALAETDVVEVGDYMITVTDSSEEGTNGNNKSANQDERIRVAAAAAGTEADDKNELPEKVAGEVKPKEEATGDKEKDFSKILYELRDEDTFCFNLRDNEDVVQRIPFLKDQMWIGTNLESVAIESEESHLEQVFARLNKDWSGVVIYPREDQQCLLNGKHLREPERLKNEDLIRLINEDETAEIAGSISFQEPVSLLALSSILPGDLPEPVAPDNRETVSNRTVVPDNATSVAPAIQTSGGHSLVLGYFTVTEILIMALGTLVTAAIIFFVLELV